MSVRHLGMDPAYARSVQHLEEATLARQEREEVIARRMFVTNLVRQAQREEEDAELRARWKARQPQIRADIARERKMAAWAVGIGLVVGAGVAAVMVALLVAYGATLAVALLIALLVSSASGCGCTVVVTHVCGH